MTPTKLAGLIILNSLEEDRLSIVLVNGAVVAQDNKPLFSNTDTIPAFALNTVHLHPQHLTAPSFRLTPHDSTATAA